MVTANVALTPAERERIHAAVAVTEQRTGTHFALVIVPVSDRYALFPVAWAAVLALSATGVLALLRSQLTIGEGFIINAALFIALAFVFDWLPLRLRIVPASIKRNHARQLAHREFASRVVGRSQHRNGVLLFVSLGERYVEVLADREIHNRVAPDTWEKLVADFIAAVRSDRLADGLVAAVEACGTTLAEHYPRASSQGG
jgi:putative membrane protein